MSFSSDIKKRLCREPLGEMHCIYSELAGMLRFSGKINHEIIRLSTENEDAVKRLILELKEGFCVEIPYTKGAKSFSICIDDPIIIENIREGILLDYRPVISCCRRAYIRGAFLSGGSVSEPQKSYHLEFATKEKEEADILIGLLNEEGVLSKLAERKGYCIIYIKECEIIARLLSLIGAGAYGLEMFSVQVEKEIRNNVNRRVNCENANADKSAKASCRHLMAIKKIKESGVWADMPDTLKEIGELRLEFPEDSLKELGKRTNPPIGKSGVNHRLNRIIELAEDI